MADREEEVEGRLNRQKTHYSLRKLVKLRLIILETK